MEGVEPSNGAPKTPVSPLHYIPVLYYITVHLVYWITVYGLYCYVVYVRVLLSSISVLHNSSIFLVPIASRIRTTALLFPFQTEPFEESEIQTTSAMSHTYFCKAFQFLAFRLVHIKPPLSQRPVVKKGYRINSRKLLDSLRLVSFPEKFCQIDFVHVV